jgi:hypothetical protein
MQIAERDLVFDFTGCESVKKLDQQGVRQETAHGMKLVDFTVREANRILLIEVKDPSDSLSLPEDSRHYARKLRYRGLVREDLAPKCRDTYSYLHLMAEDDLPAWFILVLGIRDGEGVGPAELGALQDYLFHCLLWEAGVPWKRRYVEGALVLTPQNWADYMPYGLERVPQSSDESEVLPKPARYRTKRGRGRPRSQAPPRRG